MTIPEEILSYLLLVLVAAVLIAIIIRAYNQMVKLKNSADKAFANIDVVFIQRNDEVPQLVAVVKQHSKHESQWLESLTRLRTHYLESDSINAKIDDANSLSILLPKLMAVSEKNPQLKANNVFIQLQRRLRQLENLIADRREFFNDSVELYNTGIQTFPSNLVANLFGFSRRKLLQSDLDKNTPPTV